MSIDYSELPESLRGGVQRYLEHGIPMGGFLTAVFANDLSQSFGRADENNRPRLFEICSWIYNYAPDNCHGSYELVSDWCEERQAAAAGSRHEPARQ